MNILPHKSWHVRTKKNIARVRRDQALAAEEEREKQQKINLAESESRLSVLRQKASYGSSDTIENSNSLFIGFNSGGSHEQKQHVNFFKDVEDGQYNEKTKNAEYEKEKKDEQEKFEKKIGYLTYLGQDTNEISGKRSWYENLGERKKSTERDEKDLKRKSADDPLTFINRALKRDRKSEPAIDFEKEKGEKLVVGRSVYVRSPKSAVKKSKKHKRNKKRKRHTSSSSSSLSSDSSDAEEKQQRLKKLREERLQREQAEKIRTDRLLGKKPIAAATATATATSSDAQQYPFMKQKYYSQFNPHLAKQNYSYH